VTTKRRPSKRERAAASPSMADLAASDEAAADLLDVSRVAFIRETAQLLFIRSREGAADPVNWIAPAVAWQLAQALWTSKPEDC